MRCLIHLESHKRQTYNPAYHVKLQGVIYDILDSAGYSNIHDKMPFKFLTFSNIFPPQDMHEGDERTLIIASPNKKLIENINQVVNDQNLIEPGNQQYRITSTATFRIDPEREGTMITGTPIVVRLPAERCREYGIDPGKYDDVYWRQKHNAEAFIDAIEDNLAAKYEEYYDRTPPKRPYFSGYQLRDEVSVPLHYADKSVTVIGTTWELEYECYDREMHRLMRLAYGTGVGELNATGFGFMNKMGG